MRDVPDWGVVSSVAAPALLIGGWTAAARLQDQPFDSMTETISALAGHDAQHRWVMTAALCGVGAAHLTTALALRPLPSSARWVIGAGGVATALVAANPLPAGAGNTPRHGLVAGIAFVSLGFWPALSWRRRRREPASITDVRPEPDPLPLRPAVAIAATGALLAGLGWFFTEFRSEGDRIGLSERVAAGSQALWPLVVVLAARRHQRSRRG